MAHEVEEAATLVAYAVEDGRETEETFGLVKVWLQLAILLFGVTTFFSEVECPVLTIKGRWGVRVEKKSFLPPVQEVGTSLAFSTQRAALS